MQRKRERESSEDINVEQIQKINTKKQKITEEPELNDFETFGICDAIVQKLAAKNILALFEVQKKVYKPVYEGKNIICASLTGSGKTLSFVMPIMQKNKDKERLKHSLPVCLVMAPTRELSIQVGREFSDLSGNEELKYNVCMVYGGVSVDDQIRKLRGGVDVVVGTPGRIMDMIERGELILSNLRTVVLDEADKMLSMGFQDQIEDIFKKIYESRKKVQVCLFSATIEGWVKGVAATIMQNEESVTIDLMKDLAGRTPKTVKHLAVNTLKSDKVTTIADLILCYGGKNKATIVFVNTKRECNELLISDKIKQEVQIIHGDINQKQREATIEAFKKGKVKCLVATDVASRGLDIPMVDLIIQSDPPIEIDSYIHRAGRTARAGRSGTCITLYSRHTEGLITRIEQKAKIKFTKIAPPQRKDIIESSLQDIKTSMNKVDQSMVDFFAKSAKQVIEEYGAEIAVARLFAYVSGHSDKIKSRSILCGAEGFITYSVTFKSKFNHGGYVWGFFKRILTDVVKDKIRGMRPTATMDGCVFDYPEDAHVEFEEIIFNDKMYGTNYNLVKIDVIPELMADGDHGSNNRHSSFPASNSFGNHNRFGAGAQRGGERSNYNNRDSSNGGSYNKGRSQSSGPSSNGGAATLRPSAGRTEFFVGNLPYNIDEGKLKQFIASNGINTSDLNVRFAIDKETQQHRGFGFISCADRSQVDKVLSLNEKMYNNRALKITEASTNSK